MNESGRPELVIPERRIPFNELLNDQPLISPAISDKGNIPLMAYEQNFTDICNPKNPYSNTDPASDFELENAKWQKKAKNPNFRVKEMFDLMNHSAKDICYEFLADYVESHEAQLESAGLGVHIKKGQNYQPEIKHEIRSNINDYIEYLEFFFAKVFFNATENPESETLENYDHQLLPKVDIPVELQRFNDIKNALKETIGKHHKVKAQYLYRKYEQSYQNNLNQMFENMFNNETWLASGSDDRAGGGQGKDASKFGKESTKEKEERLFANFEKKLSDDEVYLTEYNKIIDGVSSKNGEMREKLRGMM